MGSLITLLAVADVLGNNTAAVATYSKRLVLTALMGEPWGFMGSKRLLWEMYSQAATTTGLDVENLQQVGVITPSCAASYSVGRQLNHTYASLWCLPVHHKLHPAFLLDDLRLSAAKTLPQTVQPATAFQIM